MARRANVTIYTDGACSGNPGPGGWGAMVFAGGKKKEYSGYDKDTTNNRMELMGAIVALESLEKPCIVTLYSDSAYLTNAFLQGWLKNWKLRAWKNADKKPVKNMDLWRKLDELTQFHEVTFVKVQGHADNIYNNRCDKLATSAILQIPNDDEK